ncbi:hypothetical protein [Bacteroides acidifaciens]|uniref:hypothetical protein n=1 Tax=Bacteroides acidifaciens TaxID=85831 RepID=UPI003F68FD9D
MNEKSKAFELIEFVWNNEKTDSYLRVNIAMYEAVKLAIISQMKFNKEDFQNIFSKFSGVTGLESTPTVRAMVKFLSESCYFGKYFSLPKL